ncbi:hypothetical protein [Aeoliella sp.]|uniref:hypothetical protein n=1 Tax=Aeoliella sp. TaxID=2795800 RepID=UPI003CCBE89B
MPARMSIETVRRIEKLLEEQAGTPKEIGAMVGVSGAAVRTVKLGQHVHQQSECHKEYRRRDPTPEEIAAACAVFRRRKEKGRERYSFPVLSQL